MAFIDPSLTSKSTALPDTAFVDSTPSFASLQPPLHTQIDGQGYVITCLRTLSNIVVVYGKPAHHLHR